MLKIILNILLINPIIKVGVIETSYNMEIVKKLTLCEKVKDLSTYSYAQEHSTNVLGLISKQAKGVRFCFYLVAVGQKDGMSITNGLQYLNNKDVDVINISAGGIGYDFNEYTYIKKLLDKNVTIITAAGNESINLDQKCSFYPACHDKRLIVIGNKTHKSTNYGKIVDKMIDGTDKEGFNVTLTGTSQATAIYTGMWIKLHDKK